MLVDCMNGRALQPRFFIGTPVYQHEYPRVVRQAQTLHQSSSDSDSGNMMFRTIRNECYLAWILNILERQKQRLYALIPKRK